MPLNYLKLYDERRTFHPDVVCDIPSGTFGHRCRYECSRCGPIDEEPELGCVDAGSMWQPSFWELYCPFCANDEVGTHDNPRPFKAVKRFKLSPYRGHCQHGIDWREQCDDCWAMVPVEEK